MKYWKSNLTGLLLLATMSLFAAAGYAQDQQSGEPPKPAAKAYLPIGWEDDQDTNQPPDMTQPDDRPLTGFQQPTLGTPIERHSYWLPGVSYTNFIQSNGLTQGGGHSWTSTSNVVGNLSLLQNWTRSKLTVNYSGGGSFSTDSMIGNSWYQQLGAVQKFNWERWQLTVLDQFSYLPQSQFGFGIGAGIATPGVGGSLGPSLPGLQNAFNPSQSIFTAVGPRYANSFGAQVNYLLTPRSSITLGGVYGILRFTESGNIENNDVVLNAGYNYQITRQETLGVLYRFSAYHYINYPQAIGDHIFQLAYGKKITRRLALQLSGGPEIAHFRVPVGSGTQTQYVAGSAAASLTYAFAQGSVSLSYSHGVNNGSGVLLGAASDQITGSMARNLSRHWSGNVNLGYARNRSVDTATGTTSQSYNTVYVGAALLRPLGRKASFSLGYTIYLETSNMTTCAGANCGTNYTSHQITLGMSWHTRPFVLH